QRKPRFASLYKKKARRDTFAAVTPGAPIAGQEADGAPRAPERADRLPRGANQAPNRVTTSASTGRARSTAACAGRPLWTKPASRSEALTPRAASTRRSYAYHSVIQFAA